MPKIPGVNHLDAVRALEKAGFRIVRQGKHIVMSNDQRIVTVPRHNPVDAFTMGASPATRAFPLSNSVSCSRRMARIVISMYCREHSGGSVGLDRKTGSIKC